MAAELSPYEIQTINERFIESLSDNDLHKEAQQEYTSYLKAQIYENSFFDKLMPSKGITAAECDRDERVPTSLKKVYDKEYIDGVAIETTLRGSADYRYVETEGFAVRFHRLMSDRQEMDIDDIRGLTQPITQVIKRRHAFQIQKQKDISFLGACEYALQQQPATTRQIINGGVGTKITPENLVDLKNLIDGRGAEDGLYLNATTFLMTKSQYNNLYTWIQANLNAGPGTGVGAAGGIDSTFWSGIKEFPALAGCKIVVTRKNDVLPNNEVWCFPDHEFIGKHLTFNDEKFQIERKFQKIQLQSWGTYGFAIGNNYSVAKMILN